MKVTNICLIFSSRWPTDLQAYKEVPWWWYGVMFVSCVAMALGTTYSAKSGMPWWAFFVALIITTVFLPIIGTLYCTVGYAPSIENLVQVSETYTFMQRICIEGSMHRWLAVRLSLDDLLVSLTLIWYKWNDPDNNIFPALSQYVFHALWLSNLHFDSQSSSWSQTCMSYPHFLLFLAPITVTGSIHRASSPCHLYCASGRRCDSMLLVNNRYELLLMCIQGGLLNYVIMKLVLAGNRTILLDVQGSNVWSGQQVWIMLPFHLFSRLLTGATDSII